MHENRTHYQDMLNAVREQIFDSIRSIMQELGGKVALRHYHEWDAEINRNVFFECDGDGYGRELFLDEVVYNPNTGDVHALLSDTEDCYSPVWELADFSATDALYLLWELEEVANYIEESGDKVVTEYDPDYVPENW